MICQPNCVHCYSKKLTEDMRQQVLTSDICVEVFYDLWQANARTNKGQDPGPPRPIVSYQDRMGADKDMPLITWRNEYGTECKGTFAVHQQKINATLRETSRDPEAEGKGQDKEFERRKTSALNQNKKAMTFGDDKDTPSHKATSVRRESSERTKVGKYHFVKTGKPKERQES